MADRIKSFQQETNQINILKSIRTDLGATASSYTPDTSVVTKDRVVTYAQAEEELSVLGDIEEGVKQQVTDLDIAQKDIKNIKLLLQGNLYDYQTDSTSAYTKTVPQGAMPYASLNQVGGKTLVWNQICESSMYRTNGGKASGITITHTDTGFTLTGTTTGTSNTWEIRTYLPASHKFLLKGTPVQDGIALRINIDGAYLDTTENAIFTSSADSSNSFYVAIKPNATDIVVNLTWTPQLFDLTLMFGAGNEPSTYEEFQQIFPASYYLYNAGTMLSAGVTEVVSKKVDNTEIAAYPIPAEIQALDGYGWSARNAYNYVDFERKVFVKNVDRVDLGTLSYSSSSTTGHKYFFSGGLSDVIKYTVGSNSAVNNIVCDKYIAGSFLDAYNGTFNCIGVGGNLTNTGRIVIYDSAKEEMTSAEFKASLSGVYAYYELATPQEIDISEYLTDDNLIEVEAGGTLTFPNSNGTDYQIPVPSAETYMVDLQASL